MDDGKLTVRLEPQHWNAVLVWLGKAPWENVAQLIDLIGLQLKEQRHFGGGQPVQVPGTEGARASIANGTLAG